MKVTTLTPARQAIRQTARYINREFGRQSKDEFLQEVRKTRALLAANPYLGPVEPLMADRATTYRSVVVTKVKKIVYRITDDRIEIVDFWDVRREPNVQAQQTQG